MPDNSSESLFRRSLRVIGRTILTCGFVGAAGIGVVFGLAVLNDRAAAVPEPESATLTPVTTRKVALEDGYSTRRTFLGQIEPRSTVDLSFELAGLMTEVLVSEGDAVKKGAPVAYLDTALLEAEETRLLALRAATEAQLVFAQTRLDRANGLQKEGFTSVETRDRALAARDELQSRSAETDAALQAVRINLSKSIIFSPFDGQVAAHDAEASETVQAGQTIVSIMETSAPEFRVGLPLGLDRNALSSANVTVAGKSFPASLIQIRPDIDPVTRTRTALFDLPSSADLVFGQTATLALEVQIEARGFWVSLDALKQGDGRIWTVLSVDEQNTVRQAAVEVLHATDARAFVRGALSDGDDLVASGVHRVVPGQRVRTIEGEG